MWEQKFTKSSKDETVFLVGSAFAFCRPFTFVLVEIYNLGWISKTRRDVVNFLFSHYINTMEAAPVQKVSR